MPMTMAAVAVSSLSPTRTPPVRRAPLRLLRRIHGIAPDRRILNPRFAPAASDSGRGPFADRHRQQRQRRCLGGGGSASASAAIPSDDGAGRPAPRLPTRFLEAHDPRNFDPSTHQRRDVMFDPVDGRPPARSSRETSSRKTDRWHPDTGWMSSQDQRWRADPADFECDWSLHDPKSPEGPGSVRRILWSDWTEDLVRDPGASPVLFRYDDLAGGEGACDLDQSRSAREEQRLLGVLYQYGLALINGTPTCTDTIPQEMMSDETEGLHEAERSDRADASAESAILRLASIVGHHPLRTLYGDGVWSTSSHSSFYNDDSEDAGGASTADSAYGSAALPLHTDMTYMSTPPGVQVFLMVQPAAPGDSDSGTGAPRGQSVYLDGFAAARRLQSEDPDAFRVLASTCRRYRCVDDDEGWHLEAAGPAIETSSGGAGGWDGPLRSIRHNDLDRLPDLPPPPARDDGGDAFYDRLERAHEAWDDILRRDSMRLDIGLGTGDCVLVANGRCMHGRHAFETSRYPRVVMGCYVGADGLESRWRRAGLRVV